MNRLKHNKLNSLLTQWPAEGVITTPWLKENGYYKQLVKTYSDHNWIRSLGKGAYVRLNDALHWSGAVKALQSQLNYPIHIGGLTALQLAGVFQYVSLQKSNPIFYLYSSGQARVVLPVWFNKNFPNAQLLQQKIFDQPLGLITREINDITLTTSATERAILEVLALVPDKITFTHVNELMETLDRLRPSFMQELLEHCLSIKVKRLFLYLAEKNHLSCFKELDLTKIDLGRGKRVIGEGGSYHPKWLLSTPPLDEVEE